MGHFVGHFVTHFVVRIGGAPRAHAAGAGAWNRGRPSWDGPKGSELSLDKKSQNGHRETLMRSKDKALGTLAGR